jgi:ferritin-like metal-binding protein YciE
MALLLVLARVFDRKSQGKEMQGMERLIEEGSELIDEDFEESVKDAGLIGVAQRVEHYEMAGYGPLSAFAAQLARPP